MIKGLSSSAYLDDSMAPTESRRQLILTAMLRVVGEKGYEAAAVEDAIAAAQISRPVFYRHFTDKQDCFLAAYEMFVEELTGELSGNCDGKQAWTVRVTNGLTTIVERFAADPLLARAVVVEVAAAGSDARRLQRKAIDRFANLLDSDRESFKDRELPANISLMSAGAVSGLIFEDVVAGRAAELTARLPDLVFTLLVPYIGPQAAATEMRRISEAH
jgi:AcrR family transcriptional regulator